MPSVLENLSHIVGQAFEACGFSAEFGRVRVADRPDLAQFQCNGAMAAAKKAKENPREIAQCVIDSLKGGKLSVKANPVAVIPAKAGIQFSTVEEKKLAPRFRGGDGSSIGDVKGCVSNIFSKIEIAGPGFINLSVTDEYLAQFLQTTAADSRLNIIDYGHKQTALLDYGGPNIAKPMHVGHLRAAIIGDSLRRIMAFAGYKTLGDVHMGDWGTHMGMIVGEYLATGQAARIMSVNLDDEKSVTALMDELSAMYPKVSAACKESEERRAQALKDTLAIQNKKPEHYKLWEKIRAASIRGMKANYNILDVHFDLWKGESDVHDLIAPMVADLKKRGIAQDSEGAVVIHVKGEGDKKEIPPLILYKSDGAVMYGTTDLATLVERMKLYHPLKIIYVVDQRQHLHFEQVFRAARLAGIVPESVELNHAGFGTMNGPDGKPFKTRAGGVMKLEDLIAMGLEKARARLAEAALAKDFSAAEKEDIAHKVAIAAIKFADLQNQRLQDYIFDLDRLTSFEGKTGPYLLYQAVRIKSLLRKAGDRGQETGIRHLETGASDGPMSNNWPLTPDSLFLISDTDRKLALLLTALPDAFEAALHDYMPHHLCDYAYKLAQEFSSFYNSCHIISEPDQALKSSRLALCALTVRTMETVLELLGIKVPERM